MKKMFLITLREFGGCSYYYLVDQEKWDHIHSEPPIMGKDSDEVISGSWQNDRAINVEKDENYEFDSLREVMTFCSQNNINIEDEYEGYMY